jgi:ABC-type sugar transport system ATPase subunit
MEVRVEGLRFRRGPRTVLDVPALVCGDGRTTALVGPNGAGKTTLLRLIAALERPLAGQVFVGGRRATTGTVRTSVAYAFQHAVFVSGTVAQNLALALRLRGVAHQERDLRIAEATEALGIAALRDRDALRLSGGEAQRANLARALCLRAPVTLLDEPLTGLDGPARRQLLHDLPAMLRRFATTTVIVTHDRDEALRLADDLVVLIDGRVRAAGPRPKVFGDPPDAETAAFLGFTLIPADGGTIAIAPRGLRVGAGDFSFEMEVEEVLDFGVRREAWGTIGEARVSVRMPSGEVHDRGRLTVSASRATVRVFAREAAGGAPQD